LCVEEKEAQEKESKQRKRELLADRKWQWIFSRLQPYLRPYGQSGEGRLDFHHQSLSKAVRKRSPSHHSFHSVAS
jgi:hypothetical protein